MSSITLSIQYQKNRNLAISPSELKALYLFGIPINDPANPKTSIPDETFDFYIETAQREIENFLTIKIGRQALEEGRDFNFDEWIAWGYLPLTYPAVKALKCQGFMNTTMQVDYPEQWLSVKTQVPGEEAFHRQMHLVPVSGAANSLTGNSIYVGVAPYIGYFGNRNIPNYWKVTYITGFHKVPLDITAAIGKMASIGILNILGDITMGPGVASKSISIDGLSQSVSSTQNASGGVYGARIKQYLGELDKALPLLKSKYLGIVFGAI